VQKLLSSIGDIAALDRQGQPITQQIEIVKNLLEILEEFLEVYQVANLPFDFLEGVTISSSLRTTWPSTSGSAQSTG